MRNLRTEGLHVVQVEVEKLLAENIDPCLSADLWSENGIALLGQILHLIDTDFKCRELLVRATPMSEMAHTAENVRYPNEETHLL